MKCQSFSPKNNLNDTTQFSEDIGEIYIWISVPLTNHYKKCTVMWTIVELIGKNP